MSAPESSLTSTVKSPLASDSGFLAILVTWSTNETLPAIACPNIRVPSHCSSLFPTVLFCDGLRFFRFISDTGICGLQSRCGGVRCIICRPFQNCPLLPTSFSSATLPLLFL
jgi:hypothetical protein